jgi:hypothetical protein
MYIAAAALNRHFLPPEMKEDTLGDLKSSRNRHYLAMMAYKAAQRLVFEGGVTTLQGIICQIFPGSVTLPHF